MEPHGFRFSDPRQKKIYERLKLIGPGPATFYRDACILMASEQPLDSTTHLVSHLLREIESALRDVLEHIGDRSDKEEIKGANTHEKEILTILKNLEIQEDDRIVQVWLDLARKSESIGLHKKAHREALEKPRQLDEDFRKFWNDMAGVLDYVLGKFESKFVQSFELLDELAKKESPTLEDVMTLRNKVPNNVVTMGHFFGQLDSPSWLKPLNKKGFFSNPPQPERDYEEGTIRYPPWPASRYLVRMAPEEPDVVMEIILGIPETDNYLIHANIADAILSMTPGLSLKAIPIVKQWLGSSNQSMLYEKISRLIIHLANGGYTEEALGLTRDALEVFKKEKKSEKDIYLGRRDVKTHFDSWHYGQIVEKVLPELLQKAEEKALVLFCDLLEDAVRMSEYPKSDEGPVDDSYDWRPAIEDSGQNNPRDILNILVWAVRESSETLIQAKGKTILEQIEGRPFRIFHRIGLHLRRKFPYIDPEGTAAMIKDSAVLSDIHFHHELFHLLKEHFGSFGKGTKDAYLDFVEQKSEEIERYRKLWPIQEYLEGEWKRSFEELKEKYGELDHPGYLSYVSGMFGLTSPATAEDLKKMEIPEIISFLKEWEPPKDPLGPSVEGLGRELARVVTLDPVPFAEEAEQFKGTDPTYIRSLLSAFEKAVKEKTDLPWKGILKLCEWVVEQPREIPGRESERFESDPDWGETRKQIAYILSEAFKIKKAVPYNLRENVWKIIKPLTEDPDPTPEDESTYGTSPSLLSINTTRGMAVQAVIQYANWVRNHIKEEDEKRLDNGLDEMPEVREILDRHLNIEIEPSLAVRSVYGKLLPWLFQLDSKWTTRNMGRIFPPDESLRDFRAAAWEGYITHCRPHGETFKLLEDEYRYAIENISVTPLENQHHIDPDKNLAEHLMILYWWGELELKDPEGLIARFFDKSPNSLRHHALNFVGYSLNETQGDVQSEFLERLKRLWEWRVEVAREADSTDSFRDEQKAFGWWFASGKLDDDWAVEQLKISLEIASDIEIDHLVVGRLAKLSKTMPLDAVDCLDMLVRGAKDTWRINFWKNDAKEILKVALYGSNPEAERKAKELISLIVSRGYLEFKELLE